jgi:L-lactate dehydrogenase complex protein LldG
MAGLPGTPKDEFLDSVRRALGRDAAPPHPLYPRLEDTLADLEAEAAAVRRRLAEDRTILLDRLARMAQLGGWNVYRSAGYEEAVAYIGSLAASLGVDRVVRTGQEVFEQAPVDGALRDLGLSVTTVAHGEAGSRESLRQEIVAAGIGITGADYAVAETGSVVLLARRGLGRLVSVVPPVHVALVRPEEVIETLDDFFLLRRLQYHREGGEMGSYLNFITGPSRTADIEQTLVVGVHGPKEVHLVLLE